MDKFFICLANSYKRGGRCVAGVEIDYRSKHDWTIVTTIDNTPQWIRPLARTEYGEIPTAEAIPIKQYSIVKLSDIEQCPHNMHTEDMHYSKMQVIGQLEPTAEVLDRFIDYMHRSPFGNHGKALKADKETGTNYSLMLIRPEKAVVDSDIVWDKTKTKITFDHNGFTYSLPVTDPLFLAWFKSHGEKRTELSNVYLVLSLGLEYEGWHHKLVATVLKSPGETFGPAPKPYFTDDLSENENNRVSEEISEYKPLSVWKKITRLFKKRN